MKIETSTVTKLVLSELDNLDPVTVILEDLGTNQGKMIVECYGKSWSTYWGGMGGLLTDFLERVSVGYIANCMWDHNHKQDLDDYDGFMDKAKSEVLMARKKRDMDKDEAAELWEWISRSFPEPAGDAWADRTGNLVRLFGDEWWYAVPTKINPEYAYLIRVIEAVKAGVAEYAKGGEA
jgi:hypothetical protein